LLQRAFAAVVKKVGRYNGSALFQESHA
jgi:hypothetical protein